jgi:hypothetical protein
MLFKRYLTFAFSMAATLSVTSHAADMKKDHVLLISIDGMHAVDYENCVAANTCPNMGLLGRTGVNYTRTSTSRPSDSFPGVSRPIKPAIDATSGSSVIKGILSLKRRKRFQPLANITIRDSKQLRRPLCYRHSYARRNSQAI